MNRTLNMLWCTIVPLALLAACSSREQFVRIVIVPDQAADSAARQQKVKVTDLVFKKNPAGRIEEHPFFFSKDTLEAHGDGCGESLLRISISKLDEVVWEADSPFTIVSIDKNTKCHPMDVPMPREVPPPPANPFFGTMPYASTGGPAPFRVYSGPARPESLYQVYKIKISISGQLLDPDLICMM